MPKQKVVHINVVEEGKRVDMPAESVWEVKDLVGTISTTKNDIGFALARIRGSETHFHYYTDELYVTTDGEGVGTFNGQGLKLGKYEAVGIEPVTVHAVESKEGVEILALTSPPWSPADHIRTTMPAASKIPWLPSQQNLLDGDGSWSIGEKLLNVDRQMQDFLGDSPWNDISIELAIVGKAPERSYDKLTWYFVAHGKGNMLAEGYRLELKPKDLVIVPPNTQHSIVGPQGIELITITSPRRASADYLDVRSKRN